jgi:hypothetical protein
MTPTTHVPRLRTVGVLAEEVGASLAQVLYLIRKLNVQPIGRAGTLRLFDQEATEAVRAELLANAQRRGEGAAGGEE